MLLIGEISVVEAKHDLLQAMENEHHYYPPTPLVRSLAVAYLGDSPQESLEQRVDYSVTTYGGVPVFRTPVLRKTARLSSQIQTDNGPTRIEIAQSTLHQKRLLMPAVASLGSIAFHFAPQNASLLEKISVDNLVGMEAGKVDGMPVSHASFEVGQESCRYARDLAYILLALPDSPVYAN